MTTDLPPYLKPYRALPECLNILEARGMLIPDRERAIKYLKRIGYYRMSAYCYPFRVVPEGGTRPRSDQFRPDTTFDQVVYFYLFDKRLRLVLTDPLERIEIAVRAALVEVIGALGPCAHMDSAHFSPKFTTVDERGISRHQTFIDGQNKAFARSSEEFAKHFRQNYGGEPPIWIAAGA